MNRNQVKLSQQKSILMFPAKMKEDLFSSTTTFVTVDGRGIGNSKPFKPVFTEYKPDLANTKYQPVSALVEILKLKTFLNCSCLNLVPWSHNRWSTSAPAK